LITIKHSLRNIFFLFLFLNSYGYGNELIHARNSLENLTLKNAEALWLEKNHDLQVAKNQLEMAKADTLTASQRPNPQLSYNMNNLGTGRDHRYLNGSDHVVRLEQTFERGDKRALRMQSADFMLHASEADLASIQRQSKTQLYQLYYQLVLAQGKLHITEENANLYQKTIEASQLRLKAGDISASELSRLDLDKLRADNDVFQARNNLKQAQIDLAIYIGEEFNAPALEASDSWPGVAEKAYQNAINIENRADIKAAQLRLKAAESNRELALALKKRDITIGAQVEHNSLDLETNTIGLGVSIPLMTGYAYEGEIARAESEYQAALFELDHTRAYAISEINKARGDLKTAESRVLHYDDNLLKEADKVLQSAEFAYKQGAQSVMDLLDARRTYKATQIEAVSARADYAISLATWQFLSHESE
jgi:cobalt-zinc-cadmium efflux system outer membrane protein